MTFSNNFTPTSQIITAITNANPGVVTTSQPHGYDDTLIVRIVLPKPSMGMSQLNGNLYPITVLSDTTFSIPVNTTFFDSFVSSSVQYAQCIPVGETGYVFTEATKNAGNIVPEVSWITP